MHTDEKGVVRRRLSRKDFAAADPYKDGTLSKDEYLAIVEKWFKAADTKKQGYLMLWRIHSEQRCPCVVLVRSAC